MGEGYTEVPGPCTVRGNPLGRQGRVIAESPRRLYKGKRCGETGCSYARACTGTHGCTYSPVCNRPCPSAGYTRTGQIGRRSPCGAATPEGPCAVAGTETCLEILRNIWGPARRRLRSLGPESCSCRSSIHSVRGPRITESNTRGNYNPGRSAETANAAGARRPEKPGRTLHPNYEGV